MHGLSRGLLPSGILALALFSPAFSSAASAPALSWSPSGPYDFGAVYVGAPATGTFSLTNTGGSSAGPLTISLPESLAFAITDDACTGSAIGPGRSCLVSIAYRPVNDGDSDTTTLSAIATKGGATAQLALAGAGLAAHLELSPGELGDVISNGIRGYSYDFGAVASATQTFTVTNYMTISSHRLKLSVGPFGSPEAFPVSNDTCSKQVLAPAGTCTFDVTFVAPAGCNPGDFFFGGLGVGPLYVGYPGLKASYVGLVTFGTCPG